MSFLGKTNRPSLPQKDILLTAIRILFISSPKSLECQKTIFIDIETEHQKP